MTAPIRPDPKPKFVPGPWGLSDAWKRYFGTPFVSDTLSRVTGEQPVEVSSVPRPVDADPRLQGGTTQQGSVIMYGDPADDVLTHELGHVLDVRSQETGDALEVTDSVRTLFNTQRPPSFTYESATGNLPSEYVAETFRSAMEIVRSPREQQERDLQVAERSFPGITLWYNWIQKRLNTNTAAK